MSFPQNENQGEALRVFFKGMDLSMGQIAETLDMTRQNLNHHLRKNTLDKDFLRLIKEKLGIQSTENSFSIVENPFEARQIGVPYFDVDASAGPASVFNDKGELPSALINIPGFEDCNFWINCFGDSMYPRYSAGEIIACKEVEKKFVAFGEAFLVRLSDGNRYIKYIRRHKDPSYWTLVSENEKYDPFDVAVDDITNVWIIKGKIKKNMI